MGSRDEKDKTKVRKEKLAGFFLELGLFCPISKESEKLCNLEFLVKW